MICTVCSQALAEWHFWADHYCQKCWEAHCSEEWWRLGVWQNGIKEMEKEMEVENEKDKMGQT